MPTITVSAPGTSQAGQPIVADVAGIRALARDLARVAPEAAKGMTRGMAAAGGVIAEDAKQRASYSKRIPGSVKVLAARGNVRVRAGGDAAPNAAPIENRGKGFVRHPTYSPRPGVPERVGWTSKNSHPAFLTPALDARAAEVAAIIEDELQKAVAAAIER